MSEPSTANSEKPKSGKERQKAVQKQQRRLEDDIELANNAWDVTIKAGLILLELDQPLCKTDLGNLYLLMEDKAKGTSKLLDPEEVRKAGAKAKAHLNQIQHLSDKTSQPIANRELRARMAYHSLTSYGKKLIRTQKYRWSDAPTKETILAWRRQVLEQKYDAKPAKKQQPTIPPPTDTLTDTPPVIKDKTVLDKYVATKEDLMEEPPTQLFKGAEKMSPKKSPVDITEIANGFTQSKFKELVKNNPEVQAALAKALGMKHARSSRSLKQEDDDKMSMSRSMSRQMKEMMESMIQMQMWQVMMKNMGLNNSGYAPHPLNPRQVIPYNPAPQYPYPPHNSQSQKSPTEQIKELMELMQLVQRPQGLTVDEFEKKMKDTIQNTQQQNEMKQQFAQLQRAIEETQRKSQEQGQQQQFDQLRNMMLEMQREGVLQRNQPMSEVLQAMMQFQAQQSQADRQWQQQLEQYREQRIQRDAEYTNAQIERLMQNMQHGRSGMSDKAREVMEDLFLDRLRRVDTEGKDSEIQKLSLLRDMVGTATQSIAEPLGSAVAEGLKEGVRERVSHTEPQGMTATSPSATPTSRNGVEVFPAPPASPAPPDIIPRPAATSSPSTSPMHNPQVENPLHRMSGIEVGLAEGQPIPKPKQAPMEELP